MARTIVYAIEDAQTWPTMKDFLDAHRGRPDYAPTGMQPFGLYRADRLRTAAIARISGTVLEVSAPEDLPGVEPTASPLAALGSRAA